MRTNIVNFGRHEKIRQLRWMVGSQFPTWIKEMLQRKAAGEDPGQLIDELAKVCCVDEKTEVLN